MRAVPQPVNTQRNAGGRVPLSIVVLTYNEELNIAQCLRSIAGWAEEVFVVDSFSSDRTVEIAREHEAKIVQHEFNGYADQRNWSLKQLPFSQEWVLYLDADEMAPPELRDEVAAVLADVPPEVQGFYIKRRLIFMGKWIKWGGYYPTWLLRLFRPGAAHCDERSVNEHFSVGGQTRALRNDLIHHDQRGFSHWIEKHNKYATLEARELMRAESIKNGVASASVPAKMFGEPPERTQWLRTVVWARAPLLARPFLYFIYRYVFRLGFLDGREGFVYHFFQGLWFQFLTDVKYLEIKRGRTS